jgi:hypothetical protein
VFNFQFSISDFQSPISNLEVRISDRHLEISNFKWRIAQRWFGWAGICRWIIALLLVTSLPGCVHRRLTVQSNPPGARVLFDGEEVGETPTSVDFTHYGTHEVVLQKDGYDTLKTMQTVPAPWYQIPPIDFFSDNLLPFQLTNRHEFNYQLQASPTVPSTQGLRDRANNLRSEAHAGL